LAKQLSENCVYTALAKTRLDEFESSESVTVGSRWVKAERLLEKIKNSEIVMPVLFSDASADMTNLYYWAILTDIQVGESETNYRFEGLSRLDKGHKKQDLILLSTGRTIAPGFIKAYAVCKTPAWLDKLAETLS